MAFDEYQVERISKILNERSVSFTTKKMMGGLLFMVDDKMLCGTHFDKKHEVDLLMARIGSEAEDEALKKTGAMAMTFTGRKMSGFVFVKPEGFDMDEDLDYWLDLCLAYNPFAKKSKKKKKTVRKKK